MTLSFGQDPLLLLLCLLAAGGLTFWTYRQTVPSLSTGRRLLLAALRFGALSLILFLLFEPILRRLVRETRPPVLAVLIDDSQSLGAQAGDDTTAGLSSAVTAALQRLPAVEGATRWYRFGSELGALGEDVSALDSLTFSAPRTNIARALDEVRDRLRDDNLQGVLLVSDGRYNTGRNPLYIAERFPVPIYTVVVGDTLRRRDVGIHRITTNEIAYVGVELPVQVALRTQDYGGERVRVTLSEDGAQRDAATAVLPQGSAEVTVDLRYVPEGEGLRRLTVSVTRLDGEATYRNNAESFAVRVLESRRRLLLVGAAPSPDVAALRQLLETDPATEVVTRLQKAAGVFFEGPLPADLSGYDALVLAGYPGRAAGVGDAARLARAAEEGLPVLFVLDRQTDLNALRRHFEGALPVTPAAVRGGFVETLFAPSAVGDRHPVLEIPGAPQDAWRRLPPLAASNSRWQATPDARTLAGTEVRGIALGDPLLVVRSRSAGRSAAFLGAGTWRWRNVPEDLRDAEGLWPGLVANLMQWITAREDDRPVRVRPVTEAFSGGEPVQFTGQVYDESLQPVSDASVRVEVTTPDSTRYPYTMTAIGNGRYVLDVGALPEGTYQYTAEAQREGVTLGTDRGAFAVGSLTLEFRETQADAALMRQIAQRSGGRFLDAGALAGLPGGLREAGFRPLVIEEEEETPLWRRYAFLAVVVLLLTAEWFLRKRNGMV